LAKKRCIIDVEEKLSERAVMKERRLRKVSPQERRGHQ